MLHAIRSLSPYALLNEIEYATSRVQALEAALGCFRAFSPSYHRACTRLLELLAEYERRELECLSC